MTIGDVRIVGLDSNRVEGLTRRDEVRRRRGGRPKSGSCRDRRPATFVTGTIAEVFEKYDVGPVLPAEGYSLGQLRELERAIAATPCDTIVIGTPMDLRHVIRLMKPAVRVTYELEETGLPMLPGLLRSVIANARIGGLT
jgi:predicted GTPase